MKYKYTLSILLLFLTTVNVFGQATDNLKKPKHIRVIEAYGYLTGQEYSLSLIKNEFPQFEMSILKAQMSFNSTFGKSKEAMKKYLAEYLGQNEFKEYEGKLISEMKKMFSNQSFTEAIATNFISEVETRAKGNIASTILETLLYFQFSERPQDELISGFTTSFRTKGPPKSKVTDWQIKVPKSWKAEEADRPNIIQKFTSDYGAGSQRIMLMVKEFPLPKGYKETKKDLNDLFTERVMRDMVPDGAKFISFTKMTFDGNIGGMIESEQTTERLDFIIKLRMVEFLFIRSGKGYFLSCSVGSENADADLSLEMKKYLPLYKLVANSIVLYDQYK
jgi:hypothetical protein